MPWPAKPPMTLKEAKRAYKKDGAGFRYTASQMARADRLDAREEKRKKELEKDRQRVDNKRKREEKVERERVVRQKMLDEGRIPVEDTWGKVTASQPRLNKFFGQRSVDAPSPSKSNLETEVNAGAGNLLVDKLAAQGGNKNDGPHKVQYAPQDEKLADLSQSVQFSSSKAFLPSATQKSPQKVQNDDGVRPLQTKTASSAHCQPSALRELRASQINVRSSASKVAVKRSKNGPLHKSTGTQRGSLNISVHKATASSKASDQSLQDAPGSSGSTTISDGSPTEILPTRKEIEHQSEEDDHEEQMQPESTPAKKGQTGTLRGGRRLTSSLDVDDEEEDFTDGIDDETFLMLCATQKPVQSHCSMQDNSPFPTSAADMRAFSSPKRESRPTAGIVDLPIEAAAPTSRGLSESFSSVFNEIEDEDLVALAEEVEAEMATPQQTPIAAQSPQQNKAPARVPQQPKSKLPKVNHEISAQDARHSMRKSILLQQSSPAVPTAQSSEPGSAMTSRRTVRKPTPIPSPPEPPPTREPEGTIEPWMLSSKELPPIRPNKNPQKPISEAKTTTVARKPFLAPSTLRLPVKPSKEIPKTPLPGSRLALSKPPLMAEPELPPLAPPGESRRDDFPGTSTR